MIVNKHDRFRGTHGPLRLEDGRFEWRVWAPGRQSANLILFERGVVSEVVPMQRDEHDFFVSRPRPAPDGQRYGFQVDDGPVRPDPATRWQPDGVHQPSAIWHAERFTWTDTEWKGVPRTDLVIYELHVGAFTAGGTFDDIIPRLECLRELGITAIELMPIAQFPGTRNWGYDGVHPFAVQNTYGGPQGLQRLVDACHRTGLAVIVDVVYNHLGPEGNYLQEFGPYFTERYRTPWGLAFNFDQHGCDGVRSFVLDNVRSWVRDFHVDGLRLDAVHAIFDMSPNHILAEIKSAADAAAPPDRPIHIIAESDQNDSRLLDRPGHGLGLDAVWNDDFHHAVHALLTGERQAYYMDYGSASHLLKALNNTFVYDGCFNRHRGRTLGTQVGHSGDRFVVCIQNHDQVGNRVFGNRLSTILSPPQQRLAAGLLLCAPHIPLLFMGEEYGETRPFPYFCSFLDAGLVEAIRQGRLVEHAADPKEIGPDPQSNRLFESARLGWAWPEDSLAAGLRRLYRDLLAARRHWPAFRDYSDRIGELLPDDTSARVLRLRRGSRTSDDTTLVACFNLTGNEQPLDDHMHDFELLLTSEASRYRGTRRPSQPIQSLLPYEFQIYGPSHWNRP